MLTQDENETLTRVGPGTAMGDLFRLYWIPFYPGAELPRDGQPKRVSLLGEDLVVFRDSAGRPGLIANACPHRGAPLMYGRNEDCGLRCVYHGWKFDVDGQILDTPTEPEGSKLKQRVRAKTYPCIERNGVIWTFMGDREGDALPPLPMLEWNLLPSENVVVTFRVQECNWLQALEGEIDSAHAAILHGRVDGQSAINQWTQNKDLRPTFKCEPQSYGVAIGARRRIDEATNYWRVNQFLMPFWTLVPPQSKNPELSGHAWIPMDDENTLCLMFSYTPTGPFYERLGTLMLEGHKGRETGHVSRNGLDPQPANVPFGDFRTRYRPDNAHGLDYEVQQSTWFSGMPGLWVQDAACQSGVMRIWDRSLENLCASDAGIIVTRRFLLDALSAYRTDGRKPMSAEDPNSYQVRAVSVHLPADADWLDACAPFLHADIGSDFGYTP